MFCKKKKCLLELRKRNPKAIDYVIDEYGNLFSFRFLPNTFEGLKNYNLKGSIDLLFEGVDEEAYLSYEDYDATYTVEMENVKIIKLN